MYRTLIPVLLSAIAVTSAPQNGGNSDITYIQPNTAEVAQSKIPLRESRIENVPLTIPGIIKRSTEEESTAKKDEKPNVPDSDSNTNTPVNEDKLTEDNGNIEGNDSARKARSEDTTASYESETAEPTDATETYEEQTEIHEARTKAPSPRFLSKLSYFQKNDDLRSSIVTNLVETKTRKFKSRCRCEKIWNCPKLQITVPRCPNEYFLCCF